MLPRRSLFLSASLLLVSLAAGCASSPFDAVASRFKYRIPFETGSTEFASGNHIEVTAV